jgi:hypothetical protein
VDNFLRHELVVRKSKSVQQRKGKYSNIEKIKNIIIDRYYERAKALCGLLN